MSYFKVLLRVIYFASAAAAFLGMGVKDAIVMGSLTGTDLFFLASAPVFLIAVADLIWRFGIAIPSKPDASRQRDGV